MTTATRKYSPIWNQLKQKGTAKITAAKPFHKRIIHAVIKEKDLDLGYKLECSERNSRKKLGYRIQETVITFILAEQNILSRL